MGRPNTRERNRESEASPVRRYRKHTYTITPPCLRHFCPRSFLRGPLCLSIITPSVAMPAVHVCQPRHILRTHYLSFISSFISVSPALVPIAVSEPHAAFSHPTHRTSSIAFWNMSISFDFSV